MTSCERCWAMAQALGISYEQQVRRAESDSDECTHMTEDGRRIRAGQFWDEERKVDSRLVPKSDA